MGAYGGGMLGGGGIPGGQQGLMLANQQLNQYTQALPATIYRPKQQWVYLAWPSQRN